MMASNLTNQVRGIAKVVTAVATGNLKQKLSIVSRGEVAQLTDTINEMIDTLAVFADQVTTVAREVGVEGRLVAGKRAGASGTWKNLTENVNQLAENLTTQVRAISEVASAVTKGDLTRTIRVEAKGEVEALKDTINQMIANLKETTLAQPGTGLAEIEPCKIHTDAAGPKRSEHGDPSESFLNWRRWSMHNRAYSIFLNRMKTCRIRTETYLQHMRMKRK